MRIIACVEHTRYEGLDFTPVEPQEEGHVLAEALRPDFPYGAVRLDCYFCTWATPPAVDDVGPDLSSLPMSPAVANVEKALGSVGNPSLARVWDNPSDAKAFDKATLTMPKQPIVNKASRIVNIRKEKSVARTPEPTPRIRRKPVDTRKFGNISVSLYIEGLTPENFAALTTPEAMDFHDLLKSIKAETPKGA